MPEYAASRGKTETERQISQVTCWDHGPSNCRVGGGLSRSELCCYSTHMRVWRYTGEGREGWDLMKSTVVSALQNDGGPSTGTVVAGDQGQLLCAERPSSWSLASLCRVGALPASAVGAPWGTAHGHEH